MRFTFILSIGAALLALSTTVDAATATTSAATAAASTAAAPAPSTTITLNGQTLIYPPLDRPPNVQDPIVKGWLAAVDFTKIPNLPLSNGGKVSQLSANCNAPTVIQPDQGSWTCQKFEAKDDITTCPKKGVWGLTYDDGPSPGTPALVQKLDALKLHATFFVVGSRVVSFPDTVKAEHASGHQIAVHTWSHAALTSLSNEEVIAELKWTMKAIKDVTGVTPRYMRPPYGDTDNRVRALAAAVGLKTMLWTQGFDTDDFALSSQNPPNITRVTSTFKSWFPRIQTMDTGFIVLEHDLFNQTVQAALTVLDIAMENKNFLSISSVSECIGDAQPYQEFPLVLTTATNSGATAGNATAGGKNTTSSAAGTLQGVSGGVSFLATAVVLASAILLL